MVRRMGLVFGNNSPESVQELLVPMNDDVNIYDGTDINASIEKKSKNTWIEMFDMIDLTFNNLQQQNKDLKRTVNELSSKINKVREGQSLLKYEHIV